MSLFDENVDVLRGMENRGVDLERARTVDFTHVFPDAGSADDFIQACRSAGFEARNTTDDEMEHHEITISEEMVPSCENITVTEGTLGTLAGHHRGRTDGWGFFSD